jgi:hypothetical protein
MTEGIWGQAEKYERPPLKWRRFLQARDRGKAMPAAFRGTARRALVSVATSRGPSAHGRGWGQG